MANMWMWWSWAFYVRSMAGNKLVAIHQPTFFPWLGYFNKIVRCDLFIVLDNVQFPKKGGTWGNRVKLLINGKPEWFTLPVVRSYHGLRNYAEMEIDNAAPWRAKLLKIIQTNYQCLPFFPEVFPLLEELIGNPTDCLTEYNMSAIIRLAKALRLDVSKLILGSTLPAWGNATDLLISLVKAAGGTAYLCGGGAGGYQEDEKFPKAGLELIYQNFEHPVYEQANSPGFVPGLSIMDVLLNCGFEKTRELIAGETNGGAV